MRPIPRWRRAWISKEARVRGALALTRVPTKQKTARPVVVSRSRVLTACFHFYLRLQDCLVIVTDHSAYDWARILEHADLVVDTRNATRNVRGHYDKVILA